MAEKNENLLVPRHIGIIMDGNGRWAKKRGLPRKFGHREGAKTFRSITLECKKLGVGYVTYYAFSTENWARPQDEVEALMELFEKYLDEVGDFRDENIRLRFIGDRSRLKDSLVKKMDEVERESADFNAMQCLLAINYGGRAEITYAARKLAQRVLNGEILPQDIDENLFEQSLYTAEVPPVDLIIRPSGEQRLSNFLVWQAAYAEYYFTNILWPDFKPADLREAVKAYAERNRRFGGV